MGVQTRLLQPVSEKLVGQSSLDSEMGEEKLPHQKDGHIIDINTFPRHPQDPSISPSRPFRA